jgi:hypothetical protein
MHVYGGIDQFAAQRPQPRQGVIFVGASELAVSDHVRREYRREFPGLGRDVPSATSQICTKICSEPARLC